LILDAHAGYITWQDYEENLQRLQENARALGVDKRSTVREGPSLLQGLLICGICGTRMSVKYHQRKGELIEMLLESSMKRASKQAMTCH
jgi:hypothetical protein